MILNTDIVSVTVYLIAFFGTIANLILLLVFISNAIKNKVFQPLDRIIVNMVLVNLLLCCYKEIHGLLVLSNIKVFGEVGCRILLYLYHTLRFISLWSVANLSFLHLIKIRRPSHRWLKFIHRHQEKYVNWFLGGCWVVSIIFHIPYLLYSETEHVHNQSYTLLTSTNCLGPSENSLLTFLTYITVSVDFLLIILVILLNGFTIDLICRHRRKVRDTMTVRRGWDTRTARATKILLFLLSMYVICWVSTDLVWIAIVSGVLQSYQNSILITIYGTMSSFYYSLTSGIMVFGYRQESSSHDDVAAPQEIGHKKEMTQGKDFLFHAEELTNEERIGNPIATSSNESEIPIETPVLELTEWSDEEEAENPTATSTDMSEGPCVSNILVKEAVGSPADQEQQQNVAPAPAARPRPQPVDRAEGMPRPRRNRMMAQRRAQHLEEEREEEDADESPEVQTQGKIGAKKMKKLEEKQARKVQREAEEAEREERKKTEFKREEERRKEEERERVEEGKRGKGTRSGRFSRSATNRLFFGSTNLPEKPSRRRLEQFVYPKSSEVSSPSPNHIPASPLNYCLVAMVFWTLATRYLLKFQIGEPQKVTSEDQLQIASDYQCLHHTKGNLKEEEERKAKEEQEKREYEEYLKLKESFVVEEEGVQESMSEEESRSFLTEFINYIKTSKVVILEDLGAQFGLRAQDAISRIQDLLADGSITGVIDDRGKFIYITPEELTAVARFIRQRGRVSISELAQASNKLINLAPDTTSLPLEVS
ncbi:hypothetical protein XELAEV_18004849mg [Xenopus laevis]|uniref:DDRGK domain-containing protein 1 n=1 Tax=Xenopus laevis TaxID=8355 RepID=A0A974I2K4_XENLA|nr:hypothetical protein XELAEV_18004849mg [Xenopus laevis]